MMNYPLFKCFDFCILRLMKHFIQCIFSLACLLAIAACTQSETNGGTGGTGNGSLSLKPEQIACALPTDCEIITLGCCDYCNGGSAISVNKNHSAEVFAQNKATGCEKFACTAMGCIPALPYAYCNQGSCAYVKTLSQYTACTTAEDCTAVKTGCSTLCTEGNSVGVNKTYADFYTQQFLTPALCPPEDSQPQACGTPAVYCQSEQCGVTYPDLN